MMTSLRLIRLMLVDLPAWRKTEMQHLTFLCFSVQVGVRERNLYTHPWHS